MLGLVCQIALLCLASCRLTRSTRKAPAGAVGPTSGAQLHHSTNLLTWAVSLVSQFIAYKAAVPWSHRQGIGTVCYVHVHNVTVIACLLEMTVFKLFMVAALDALPVCWRSVDNQSLCLQ